MTETVTDEILSLQYMTLAVVCLVGVVVNMEFTMPYGREVYGLLMFTVAACGMYAAFKTHVSESDTDE